MANHTIKWGLSESKIGVFMCVCSIEPNYSVSEDLQISFKVVHLASVLKLSLRDTWFKFLVEEVDDLLCKLVRARLNLKFRLLATCCVYAEVRLQWSFQTPLLLDGYK